MSPRQRRFVLISGIFFALLLCLSGGTAAVFLAQRYLREEPAQDRSEEESGAVSEAAALSEQGLLITSVAPDSPAGMAKLRRGQIILRIDGMAVDSPQALRQILQTHEAGDTFTLDVFSGQETRTISLILGEREAYLGTGLLSASTTAFSGGNTDGSFSSTPIQPDSPGSELSQNLLSRAFVVSLVPGSPAAKAGLQRGDIITNVDDEAILSNQELITTIGDRRPGSGDAARDDHFERTSR
jgi:S1-C subfamily serine protease